MTFHYKLSFLEGCAGNCSGGGTCQSHFGQWKCLCDSIHYGENCQLTVETDCEDGIDNDNGKFLVLGLLLPFLFTFLSFFQIALIFDAMLKTRKIVERPNTKANYSI